MKRRRIIVLAVAVALAFASSGGPRHAQAATQNPDHSAVAATAQDEHAHHGAGGKHSHEHDASAASKGDVHDPINGQPASDQGCCYAWCNSVAVIHAVDWLFIGTTRDDHFASEKPHQIVAFSAAIDPPPR